MQRQPRLQIADGLSLIYVRPDMPGFSRVKTGTTFRYRDTNGEWLSDAKEIARIRQLAIPPAYERVWICPLANGHLQATGQDARGRTQYRYHAGWRALKDQTKFDRLEAFGQALPRIRARVARDLQPGRGAPLKRTLVLATLVRLLDTTFVRVGNEEYASSNGSFGLTTLRNRHAQVRGSALMLRFRGKSGVMHEARVDDPRVANVVRRCQQLPGQELFQYQDEDGAPHSLSSTDVNDYLREAAPGGPFTAKDFRTWHGTVQALELTRLACNAPLCGTPGGTRPGIKEILAAVAARLGNTPAVCKKAYVHPAVLALGSSLAADADAMTDIWKEIAGRASGARRLLAAEARLLTFLRLQRRRASRNARQAAPKSRTRVEPSRVTA
ncbi:DNA topoisomerase IB [Variovorax sp. dw_308]|uniref:DNA topoisomerase IB n=1 Tax=Variovorax sp. dw_308 TaxID=2721546 RepID=UPI00210D04E4|nr:DNA topoisomerase IB [Variovorax sp. dw_308]